MTAMDPVAPSPPSSAWTVVILSVLCLTAIAVCVWNWRHAEPVGTPPAGPDPADQACALTVPDVTPWLPADVDPRDDGGVGIDVPFALDEEAVFAAMIAPLSADRPYRRLVENLERQMESQTS